MVQVKAQISPLKRLQTIIIDAVRLTIFSVFMYAIFLYINAGEVLTEKQDEFLDFEAYLEMKIENVKFYSEVIEDGLWEGKAPSKRTSHKFKGRIFSSTDDFELSREELAVAYLADGVYASLNKKMNRRDPYGMHYTRFYENGIGGHLVTEKAVGLNYSLGKKFGTQEFCVPHNYCSPYRSVDRDLYVSNVYKDQNTGVQAFTIYAPIKNKSGEIIADFSYDFYTGKYFDKVQMEMTSTSYADYTLYLIRSQGQIGGFDEFDLQMSFMPIEGTIFQFEYSLWDYINEYLYILYTLNIALVVSVTFFRLIQDKIEFKSVYHRDVLMDELSGVYNRKALDSRDVLEKIGGLSGCVIAVDVDKFKYINDTFGHKVGDDAIRFIGEYLSDVTRESDIVIRTGGDEFLVLLPGARIDQGEFLLSKIRGIQERPFIPEHPSIEVSTGIAEWGHNTVPHQILYLADESLYNDKKARKQKEYCEECQ